MPLELVDAEDFPEPVSRFQKPEERGVNKCPIDFRLVVKGKGPDVFQEVTHLYFIFVCRGFFPRGVVGKVFDSVPRNPRMFDKAKIVFILLISGKVLNETSRPIGIMIALEA